MLKDYVIGPLCVIAVFAVLTTLSVHGAARLAMVAEAREAGQ